MQRALTNKMMDVAFPSADPPCELRGDLYLPPTSKVGETVPAIVVVAGSGPVDRNGNAPSVRMNFNTSNRFAAHMSTRKNGHAAAVLTYDKRGVGESKNPDDKNWHYRAGMMDFVHDAVEAVRFASRHPTIDKSKIVLLGHSEGAIILPLICHEVSKAGLEPILGCIFYAGFGENLVDAMKLQRETLVREVNEMPAPQGWLLRRLVTKERLEKQYDGFLGKVNAEDEPDFVAMYPCGLGGKQPAKWLREHVEYDANDALAKHITCHCLAITGQKDFQVRNDFCMPERAAKLAPYAKSVEVHRPENLTHALRSMEGEAKMLNLKQDYKRMGKLPLDEELLSITDEWCDRILFGK